MSAKPIPVAKSQTPEWFAARATGIGASEIAAAAGLSPYQTPLELYLRKRGEIGEIEDNDAMRMGRLLEPVVKAEFCRAEGVTFADPDPPMFRHAEHKPIIATPDAIIDERTLFEAKTSSWRMKGEWGDEGTDSVPTQYVCQTQMQMAVLQAEAVRLAVLFDGAVLKTFDVLRNDELITLLISAALELWERIQNGDPPEPTWAHASTPQLIRQMHSSIGDTRIQLSPDACAARRRYDEIAKEIKALDKEQEQCRAVYEHEIGEHFAGVLDDGRMIRRALIKGGPVSYVREDRIDYRAVKFDGGEILNLIPEQATA